MQKRSMPSVVLPLLVSTFVYATDDTVAPVIVTATRTAQTADETLSAVTVITRQDIEQQQTQSVEDVLRDGLLTALHATRSTRRIDTGLSGH